MTYFLLHIDEINVLVNFWLMSVHVCIFERRMRKNIKKVTIDYTLDIFIKKLKARYKIVTVNISSFLRLKTDYQKDKAIILVMKDMS